MVPSFREKAEDLLERIRVNGYVLNGVIYEETEALSLVQKELLDAYTLGLNTAIKAIDKWTEVPTFPDRFNKNKMENK